MAKRDKRREYGNQMDDLPSVANLFMAEIRLHIIRHCRNEFHAGMRFPRKCDDSPEPPRFLRRFQLLRRWSHEDDEVLLH